MNKIIDKIKEIERELHSEKARAGNNRKLYDELNRALNYLADARTTLRVASVLQTQPPTK